MQCVILAGGLGTRLGELARTRPKTLALVGGRPFADHQLGWLAGQGVDDVVYCIGHLGDQIREFVGDGSQWGIAVRYVDEGDRCLGTGGALRLAHDEGVLADHFFVLYGDSWLSVDLGLVERRFGGIRAPALMTVFRNDDQFDTSNVWFAARADRRLRQGALGGDPLEDAPHRLRPVGSQAGRGGVDSGRSSRRPGRSSVQIGDARRAGRVRGG